MRTKKPKAKTVVLALPSAFTLISLCLGFLSLLASFHGRFLTAGWLIVLAAVLDGIDGLVARSTKTTSAFGIELDSLADAVSFATATGILVALWGAGEIGRLSAALGFIFLAAGILRLARYNVIQANQKNRSTYLGLTVPSAAVFIVSLIMVNPQVSSPFAHKLLLFLSIPLISGLMVSRLRYPNFLSSSLWRRFNLQRALIIAFVIAGFYLHSPLALFILASINVISGPFREAWRLTQKTLEAKRGRNEVPLG